MHQLKPLALSVPVRWAAVSLMLAALAGYDVLVHDINKDLIESGLATVNGNLARQVSSGKITDKVRKAAVNHIQPAVSLEDLASADLVIEAATEEESVKRAIYNKLCPVLNPQAILATNTSSLSITRLASATDRPEKFIGIHFMNPVPMMQLVELVRGIATDDKTFEASQELVAALGQGDCGLGRFPRLHGQPYFAADDQRSRIHAL